MTGNYRKLLQDAVTGEIRFNVPMSDIITYKIGGPAEMFLATGDEKDIVAAARSCIRHKIPLTVIGAGSNVLAPDEGVAGLVLRVYSGQSRPTLKGDIIEASAAVSDENLSLFACENGLSGFEFIYDIPGSVGGAVMQNAGTNDGQTKDFLIEATYIDKNGEVVTKPVDQLRMGYRTCLLKEEWGLILSALFKAGPKKDSTEIKSRMDEIRKTRRSKFPMELPNCGSVFKRPVGHYAGKLIQDSQLSGFQIGGAMVSPKHRGFIVNTGGATAKDVKDLVAHVQATVKEKFGVDLERELIFLDRKPKALA